MKFNKLIPELMVTDFNKSLNFYKNIGFKTEYLREEFAFLSFQKSQIMIQKKNDYWKVGELKKPYGRGINFQIEVENINNLLKTIKKNKYKISFNMEKNCYKVKNKIIRQKEFLIQDPDGYLFRFFEEV